LSFSREVRAVPVLKVVLIANFVMAGKANKPVPAFLGYIVHQGVTFLADKFLQACWLPIILDLDETLLVANSAHQLSNQIFKAESNRYTAYYFDVIAVALYYALSSTILCVVLVMNVVLMHLT